MAQYQLTPMWSHHGWSAHSLPNITAGTDNPEVPIRIQTPDQMSRLPTAFAICLRPYRTISR